MVVGDLSLLDELVGLKTAYIDEVGVYFSLADGDLNFLPLNRPETEWSRIKSIPKNESILWLSEGTVVTTKVEEEIAWD